jgi:hypothetical protein
MRGTLLLLSAVLVFSAFIALIGQTTNVGAIGAPTDNTTIPNIPTSDQAQDEIKPPVKYILQGPSSQSQAPPPNFIPGFIGASERDRFKVTANESWYLDVDINAPGWLYIYEYFPPGADSQGRWIAYKWQLPESGLWRLGPFSPRVNEPEGQHIYRFWFYSDGQWAAENPAEPQRNLVYWTYSRCQPAMQPAGQIPPQPTPVKEATFPDSLWALIITPLGLVLGTVVLVIAVALGLYMSRKYQKLGRGRGKALFPTRAVPEEPSAVASAKIVLPNGIEVRITGISRVIGRGDLARALGLDELGLISRRHFEVKTEDGQFYIEDLGSANGTILNGEDISGKGPVSLNDDDVIEPAGTVRLKFYIL